MTFRLGLTGSIGMGKSTTGRMFTELGHPLWDADAAVHRLYAQGGAAVAPVGAAFPSALNDQAIDRTALKAALAAEPGALKRLESIVHPLVAQDRQQFIENAKQNGAKIVVLDIPLLFETGGQSQMDGVAVVSTDAETQRQRVMARPGMSAETFAMILSRQMPDSDKRKRADWVIPSDTMDGARAAIMDICAAIMAG